MAPIYVVLVVIFLWCIFMRFQASLSNRRRVIWVEVLDAMNDGQSITRKQAKLNLHQVNEQTNDGQKNMSFTSLFDKYWYHQREMDYSDSIRTEMTDHFPDE